MLVVYRQGWAALITPFSALLNFICTNVLHTQVLALHEALRKASSLDEMVDLHEDQYVRHSLTAPKVLIASPVACENWKRDVS